mmetsp:Transcript_17032/g.39288  ORF Transcript_17032/g.39288 Transcript_17032/m.39288 type:complete len:292 (-) Transcript_17032:29-904(-)
MVGRAKWDAWHALKGLPREEARQRYIELAKSVGFDTSVSAQSPEPDTSDGEGSGGVGVGGALGAAGDGRQVGRVFGSSDTRRGELSWWGPRPRRVQRPDDLAPALGSTPAQHSGVFGPLDGPLSGCARRERVGKARGGGTGRGGNRPHLRPSGPGASGQGGGPESRGPGEARPERRHLRLGGPLHTHARRTDQDAHSAPLPGGGVRKGLQSVQGRGRFSRGRFSRGPGGTALVAPRRASRGASAQPVRGDGIDRAGGGGRRGALSGRRLQRRGLLCRRGRRLRVHRGAYHG